MKSIPCLILALALLASFVPSPVAAQAAAAPDQCPCSNYRFIPKTEKAKAVAAFWDARTKYKVASGFGAMALIFTEMSRRPTNELHDAQRAMGDAQDELLKDRARAVELHGLTVQGDGPLAPVLVTLKKGVDYELNK